MGVRQASHLLRRWTPIWAHPRYRRRFFFFGGFGGGFDAWIAAAPAGVAATGAGMIFWITNCCPIVQKLVVIQ